MQARTDTTIFFLSSIVSSSLNTKTAAELMSVKEDDSVESFSKEDTDRIFFILQMQRAMFENLYDQNKRGLLTEGYYEGAPTKNLKRIAGAFLAFKIAMSTEFEAEVRRVLALP